MNEANGDGWTAGLETLRLKIEAMEHQHSLALQSLKNDLVALERRAPRLPSALHQPTPVTSPPAQEEEPVLPPAMPLPALPPAIPSPAPVAHDEPPGEASPPLQFELRLGRVWLVRGGIVLVLTGLILLGNFAYQNWIRGLPNGARLAALFLCAGALAEVGRRLASSRSYHKAGEVILAGGMAFFYYCTFAAHHVPRLRVIDGTVLAGLLLLGAAGAIAAVSWMRNTRTTAVLGLLLASYSTMLQPIGWLSCISNVILAAAGVLLMQRPGWIGPGVASMVGSYAAFAGWQIAGAARGDLKDPAVLWFLPPVWALFSYVGLNGRFRESLSERGRAWFTGANNAAFFLLFVILWLSRHGAQDLWQVCAVFGALLIMLGIIGTRSGRKAGAVHLSQGLAAASTSLVLKLQGYHLPLALAGESMALAWAFLRYRGRTEKVFCVLTAIGVALALALGAVGVGRFAEAPAWSIALTALLLGAASVTLRIGTTRAHEAGAERGRLAGTTVFAVSVAVAAFAWGDSLEPPARLVAMAALACALSAGYLVADRKRILPESVAGSLFFLLMAVVYGRTITNALPFIAAAIASLVACVLWHRAERPPSPDDSSSSNPVPFHGIPAWAFAAASAAAVGQAAHLADTGARFYPIIFPAAGLALIGLAALTRSGRLALAATAIGIAGTASWVLSSEAPCDWTALAISGVFWTSLIPCGRLTGPWRTLTGTTLRISALVTFCGFWCLRDPATAGDAISWCAAATAAAFYFFRKPVIAESHALLAIGLLGLTTATLASPWHLIAAPHSWRGVGVIAAFITYLAILRSRRSPAPQLANPASATTFIIASIWASQMLVWRLGWESASILWTAIGFTAVSVGLWGHLPAARKTGLLLLSLALLKVFAMDVWDFNAFMRVIAFIALGVALILLGLFYNRFTETLKHWIEEDRK